MRKKTITTIEANIKRIAKNKKITLKSIYKDHLGISQTAWDKQFISPNFPFSKKLQDIADFLGVTTAELKGIEETQPEVLENEIKEPLELYHKNNNLDDKTLLHVLKSENLLLQQIIDRQDRNIEFLKGQLEK